MAKQQSSKRSPLKEPPLRLPGQWLDEEINRIRFDRVDLHATWITLFLVAIIFFWLDYFLPSNANPLLGTIIFGAAIVINAVKLARAKQQIKQLELGRDGERVVGQALEELRTLGMAVLHDIQGDNFNVDHVVFSKKGIFVVETKTLSKPVKGQVSIDYDGKNIFVAGLPIGTGFITQVTASSKWLGEQLRKTTGIKYPVKGVIVFPEWFVEPRANSKLKDIWMLNPKALASFIDNEPDKLKEDEIHMAVYHLSQYVRFMAAEISH